MTRDHEDEGAREAQHRTLFAIDIGDGRARPPLAGSGSRGRKTQGRSSDVHRFFWVFVAALAGCVGLLLGWAATPGQHGGTRGALALPHKQAGLGCESCHQQDNAPTKACVSCHGAHRSTRSKHAALVSSGELGCNDCHDVHGSDQGIRWIPEKDSVAAIRYWVGRQQALGDVPASAEGSITVPLVPLARCQSCHSLANERDPLWRCVMHDGAAAPRDALNGCFDEHRRATDITPRDGGVCAAQHGGQRFANWETARATVAQGGKSGGDGERSATPLWWLAGGLLGAAFGGFGAQLWQHRRQGARQPNPQQKLKPAERVRLPQINTNTCLGCYACVDACPYDVLEVERYIAKVSRPEACCGLSLCEQVCPNGSLVITDGEKIGDRPDLDDSLQSNQTVGVFLAGDITGLPLIKNAIAQGHAAVTAIAASLPRHDEPLDLLIVGAGPAGISAALRAKELNLSYQVIEQGSVAQSIRSFPRGKLVFAQPLELPAVGQLWLEESTKEELLAKWLQVVRQERLTIRENTRFVGIERVNDGLIAQLCPSTSAVATQDRDAVPAPYESLRAARVLLCIGQRGTPRKLPLTLSAAAENKVHYHLSDAASFAGKHILVVGLGDVAMESAIALARQKETRVTVSYRGADFSRGKSRNVAELKRLGEAGIITMLWESRVSEVGAQQVTMNTQRGVETLENDVVFVMIGSMPPRALLEASGIALTN